MKLLSVINPFSAPVFYEETVSSTMTVSCELAAQGQPHGTVILADFQEAGRGRGCGRTWEAEKGKVLVFTVLLRYPEIHAMPGALTLRAGLAVCLAIEDFFPVLKDRVTIKWPNDIIIDSKKVCGILAETDGTAVHIGIGVNVCQTEFPPHLQNKAISLCQVSGASFNPDTRFGLLEKILENLYTDLDNAIDWHNRIEERLYKKGGQVTVIAGAASSGEAVYGRLFGIGPAGELLIKLDGEDAPISFFSGELAFE
jgi:BirA family biotin operon repressor/biotin-[acetyl-CoA-carboxylase] ligase